MTRRSLPFHVSEGNDIVAKFLYDSHAQAFAAKLADELMTMTAVSFVSKKGSWIIDQYQGSFPTAEFAGCEDAVHRHANARRSS